MFRPTYLSLPGIIANRSIFTYITR